MQEPYDQYAGAVKRAFNRLDEVKWVSLHDVPADEMPPILVRQIGEDPTDAVRETTERFSVDIVDVERETVAAGECQIFVSL